MAFKTNVAKVEAAAAAADAKAAGQGKGGGGVRFFTFEGSTATLRVMPAWTDQEPFEGQFWRIVHQHWNVTEEFKAPILCPKSTPHLGGPCPICDFVDELRKDKDNPAAKELANDIRAKQSYLFTVIDTKNKTYTAKDVADWKKERPDKEVPFEVGDPKLQVYAAPFVVYNAIITLWRSGGDIVDLEHGHDLTISKQGSGLLTKYNVTPNLKPSKSNVEQDNELIKLENVGALYDEAKLRELLTDGIGGEYLSIIAGSANKKKKTLVAENKQTKSSATKPKRVEVEVNDDDEVLVDGDGEDEDDLSDLAGDDS
jgi:hypothetical protein